jgi:predicted Zn finger-like uncharacterized protein
MDVRCDRCQTEYELEDETVAENGASVQCTNCGHTFIVARAPGKATPTPVAAAPDPATPVSWMLTTDEGKSHRFRDPTTLQKWIVERRVGRNDRVSPPGGTWRRLGDMDELRPFFEVVDQADRSAAAARLGRPTAPETPGRKSAAPTYTSHDDDDDDVLSNGGRRGRGGRGGLAQMQGQPSERLDSEVTAGIGDPDEDANLLRPPRTGLKVAVGALILGLAGVAAYLGNSAGLSSSAKETASAPAPEPAKPAPAAPPPAPAAAAKPASAPPPGTPPAHAPSAAAPSPPVPTPAPKPTHAAAPKAAEQPVAGQQEEKADKGDRSAPAKQGSDTSRAGASDTGSGRGRSYEQLVADGDRALENGNTAKAQKMFDEALRLQPDGVSAMTGAGYVLLDRQKPLAAIGMFKRALSSAPAFPQALFGLGEAYRSQGDPTQAVEAYRRYLSAAPGGPDAPAARRQIRDLEGQTSSRHAGAADAENAQPE